MAIVRNTIKFSSGGGSDITVVANYSALPDPTTVSGQFYWCSSSQGTSWLPGSLGGTYYNSGLYYSNGTTWEFLNVPYNATQSEVNAGTNNDKFVTPKTLLERLAKYLQFDTTATETSAVGKLKWNDSDGTLDLGLKGGNVVLQIGQEQLIRVVNKTATNITLEEANYQAVRITGAQGQRLKVDLAQATTDTLSAETIGLVTETIANNQEGFITTSGLVRNIDTTGSLQSETWADGDILYLSPTTAGRVTNIKPTAPNHLIVIGYVVYSHAVNGSIYVKVDNGYELDELHNVLISSPSDNQSLVYENATQLWKNKSLVSQTITNGVTDKSPSEDAVFDALELKQDIIDPIVKKRYFEDFQGFGIGTAVNSIFFGTGTLEYEGNIFLLRSGTGATWSRVAAENGRAGIIRGGTGTTNVGNVLTQFRSIWLGSDDILSQTSVRLQTLSDATNRYTLVFSNGVCITNSIRFFYSDNVNSGKWQCETYSSSVSTLVDSGVTVAINTSYDLKVCRLSGICYFYINNVLVATISTNIPSGIESFCGTTLTKTAGTTSRTCDFDYLKYYDL